MGVLDRLNSSNNDSYLTDVHNLNGTTDNKPPKGYSSEKKSWEAKSGMRFGSCSCCGSGHKANVGAYIQKSNERDKTWYIVPLCYDCNNKPSSEQFHVRSDDLVPINQ